MEHLTSQALDRVIQMLIHLSIPAIAYSADDEFENHFMTHNGIEYAGIPISVPGLPEHNYAAFDAFTCTDGCPETVLPVLKPPFFPRSMEVTEQPRGIIRD